jgi:hypothetical protein
VKCVWPGRACLVLATLVVIGQAGAQCPIAQIISPKQGEVISTMRPTIEWQAISGMSRYRIQIESRVPEGIVLAQLDTLVAGTQFVPPADFGVSRTAVKLLVTGDCPDAPNIADRRAWFFIDMASACPAPSTLTFSGTGPVKVEWAVTTGATRYQIECFQRRMVDR